MPKRRVEAQTSNREDPAGSSPKKRIITGSPNSSNSAGKIRHLSNLRAAERSFEGKYKTQLQENEELKKRLKAKDEAFNQLQQDRDNLRQRLSVIASSRLRDNNPNITDLSDENRPTKLGEKMSELYDNEWTDAFYELQNGNDDEEKNIQILLQILMQTYKECMKISTNQMTLLKDIIGTEKESQEILKSAKDLRKKRAKEFIEKYAEEVDKSSLAGSAASSSPLMAFSQCCRELSWYMVLQDPPLCLCEVPKGQDDLDTKLYREYTRRGPYVQFVVWPPVLLYEGGPVVCKGVAQGGKTRPSQSENRD